MADTTYEEACRCPKCKEPGAVKAKRSISDNGLPRGTTVHSIYCENHRCEWNGTPWMVQVNPDGTVPAPKDHRGEAKVYVGFEGHDQIARDIRRAIEAESVASTQSGCEIKRSR